MEGSSSSGLSLFLPPLLPRPRFNRFLSAACGGAFWCGGFAAFFFFGADFGAGFFFGGDLGAGFCGGECGAAARFGCTRVGVSGDFGPGFAARFLVGDFGAAVGDVPASDLVVIGDMVS